MLWNTLLLITIFALPFSESVVLCYYESWAVYRTDEGKVDIEDLDPALCTHYIYAFAGINTDNKIKARVPGRAVEDECHYIRAALMENQPATWARPRTERQPFRVLDPWLDLCDDDGQCGYDRFTGMKENNPDLLTLLSVGGWNDGSALYSEMASSVENRTVFINSSVELLKAHNFDGIDLDWEYPTLRGGAPEDKENYVTLLRELKEALQKDGLVLTVSVGATRDVIEEAYDIPGIAPHVDLTSVMTYDFHGSWEPYTHHHSGLYAFYADDGENLYKNVDAAISYWVGEGMPSSKLVMGVPLYGRCWTLDTEIEHGYFSPANLPGNPGPWTGEEGLMAFSEICKAQLEEGWTLDVEEGCHEPYTYHMPSNRIWCSYENHDSVTIKGQYAADQGLAGVMVWAVDHDDVRGSCTGRKFDLTQTLVETFNGSSQ